MYDASFKESLGIFWQESATSIILYVIYAIIVLMVVCLIEYRSQHSTLSLGSVVLSNAVVFVSTLVLLLISYYLLTWRSTWFGNEFVAFLITTSIVFITMMVGKKMAYQYVELSLPSPNIVSIVASIILLAPYVVFIAFIFALGKAWRN